MKYYSISLAENERTHVSVMSTAEPKLSRQRSGLGLIRSLTVTLKTWRIITKELFGQQISQPFITNFSVISFLLHFRYVPKMHVRLFRRVTFQQSEILDIKN